MKYLYLLSITLLAGLQIKAQQTADHYCAKHKAKQLSRQNNRLAARVASTNGPENNYDLKFYHLNINVERNSLFISGNVKSTAKVLVTALDSFAFVLHQNHTIDSVYVNGANRAFVRRDSLVMAYAGTPIPQNQLFDATVYYHGTCPSGGGAAIGNGYNIDTSPSWGNEVSWSLSESFVAYEWWPCKQDLKDKIDSSWVYATTDSTNLVGSNGLLKNIVVVGNKKRFEWKSTYPIDYYLISVATAKYKQYNFYAKPQFMAPDSLFIQNFIYDNAISNSGWNTQKTALNKMKQTIELQSTLFGPYPFHKEKYGHCMAPLGGGMEHQTMTTLGFFEFELDAHELGHQWWGDNVTCKSWRDIFINEGWATYSEYLTNLYLPTLATQSAASKMNDIHNNVMQQPGGSSYISNADTMNTGVIFSSRLTYDKGAAIVHMLRYAINNDSTFFKGIRSFQNTYKGSTASVIDFKTFMENYSGLNFTQFFNQWYYGEGYPTFNVKWNQVGSNFFIQSAQTQSMPSSVPLFITDMDYRISRTGKPDTIVRLNHAQATENYTLALTGTVTSVFLDPNNWILNKTVGPVKDATLGVNGIEEIETVKVFVGPNPTAEELNIALYNNEKVLIELIDMNGKLIINQTINGHAEFNVGKFANGIYTLNIKNQQNEILKSTKVVKN